MSSVPTWNAFDSEKELFSVHSDRNPNPELFWTASASALLSAVEWEGPLPPGACPSQFPRREIPPGTGSDVRGALSALGSLGPFKLRRTKLQTSGSCSFLSLCCAGGGCCRGLLPKEAEEEVGADTGLPREGWGLPRGWPPALPCAGGGLDVDEVT